MDNTKETISSNITNNEQTNIESENYNFSDFIKIFTTDSVFQINHIKFPLEDVSIEWDGEGNDSISTSYIKKSEWKYYSFPDTIYDGIKLKHPIDTTNFTYTELGVDTGVRIDYYFEKTGTQWLLINRRFLKLIIQKAVGQESDCFKNISYIEEKTISYLMEPYR